MRYCLCTKSTQTTIHDVAETKKARQGRSTPPAVTRKQGRAKANDYFACSTTLGYDLLPLCISIHPTPQRDSTTSPHSHSANPLHRPATPLPRLLSRILLHTQILKETRTENNEKKWAEITNARSARRRSRVPSMSLDICVLVSPPSLLYSFLVGPCKSSLHNEWTHIMEYIHPSITPSAHIRPSPTFRYAGGCAGRLHNPVS
jgi:hypothetical protein